MTPGAVVADTETSSQRLVRSALLGAAVGVGLGVAAVAVAFALVSIPIYVIGTDDGSGLDRDLVRIGLFAIAVPVGVLVGSAGGFLVARWYARGAHLPEAAGR
jgi:hypothetical protein